MDIWLFAAAAGAGCLAHQCKKLRKGKQNLLDSSCRSPGFGFVLSEFLQTKRVVQDKNLLPYDALEEDKVTEECCSEIEQVFIDTSTAEMASSSKDDLQSNGEGVGIQGVNGLFTTREMGVFSGFTRKRKSLMCKRTKVQSLKPLTSLESCVMAQFHKEQGAIDDYNITCICSPHTQSINPFLLARKNNVINRTITGAYGLPNGPTGNTVSMDATSQEMTSKSGVPQLPTIELPRKSKFRISTAARRRAKGNGHHLQGGSSDKAVIFLLGVSFGIMSSIRANKQEVDKLNGLLKTSENLVQDLQEELDMKETLTVKEIAVEDYEKQDEKNAAFNVGPHNVCSLEENQDKGNAEEKCFSKIEAELEAELERLELNMSACNVAELGEEGYVPDMAEGELKVKIINEEEDDGQAYADLDGSGSSPVHPADYAVSPRELSLKLHEVIQSRLERRVKELEAALEMRIQSKDRFVDESEHTTYWREFSNSNSESSSIQASPVLDAVEQQINNQADQSTIVMKEEEVEEQNTPFNSNDMVDTQERQYTWVYNGRLHNSIARNPLTEEKKQPLLFRNQEKGREEDGIFSLDFISSEEEEEEEEEEGSEEMEKLLIQHIVEQARKGSPVVLNAHKMLFDDDDDEP